MFLTKIYVVLYVTKKWHLDIVVSQFINGYNITNTKKSLHNVSFNLLTAVSHYY